MPANNDPIFALAPTASWTAAALLTANTAVDGTGTVNTVYTAGSNGGWCEEVIFAPLGTNVATVGRLFLNNGSSTATPANNAMIGQITLPATTLSNTSALFIPRFPIKMALTAGYKITVVIATTVAAGFIITGVGADY